VGKISSNVLYTRKVRHRKTDFIASLSRMGSSEDRCFCRRIFGGEDVFINCPNKKNHITVFSKWLEVWELPIKNNYEQEENLSNSSDS